MTLREELVKEIAVAGRYFIKMWKTERGVIIRTIEWKTDRTVSQATFDYIDAQEAELLFQQTVETLKFSLKTITSLSKDIRPHTGTEGYS